MAGAEINSRARRGQEKSVLSIGEASVNLPHWRFFTIISAPAYLTRPGKKMVRLRAGRLWENPV
jgi:hypothetical protein